MYMPAIDRSLCCFVCTCRRLIDLKRWLQVCEPPRVPGGAVQRSAALVLVSIRAGGSREHDVCGSHRGLRLLQRTGAARDAGLGRVRWPFCIQIDEFCSKNDEFCSKNDGFWIKNDDLHANIEAWISSGSGCRCRLLGLVCDFPTVSHWFSTVFRLRFGLFWDLVYFDTQVWACWCISQTLSPSTRTYGVS